MTDVRFQGDLSAWQGFFLALALAVLAALIYFREVRSQPGRIGLALPALRGLAVFLLVLMLAGPVLHLTISEPVASRVLVFVDASQSMAATDAQLDPLRKLRLMKTLGLLADPAFKDDADPAAATRAAAKLVAAPDAALRAALIDFNAMTRWRRVELLLMGRHAGLLRKLARNDATRLDLYALAENQAPRIWWSEQSEQASHALPYQPSAATTDLADGLKARTDAEDPAHPTIAAVLISDGQHNAGPSPLPVAQLLGNRKLPLYTIGVGSADPPPDLAVAGVEAPASVFFEDRVKGKIVLHDTMPPGKKFTLTIQSPGSNGDALPFWQKAMTTDGTGTRRVDFDFAIAAAAQAEAKRLKSEGVEAISAPLSMTVVASPLDDEVNKDNNEAPLMVRAVRSKRKVLLLDGRPRWEFRYLRNLFERDPQWEVNAIVAGVERSAGAWPRGTAPGTFPQDEATLMGYDLVILGEAPLSLLRPQEVQWLRDFVGDRGGGLVLIDGPRGVLQLYAGTPLGVLFPIEWRAGDAAIGPWRLRPTDRGRALGPLNLAADPVENERIWARLRGPHAIAFTTALAGAETLAEAVAPGGHVTPALVARRYGAGNVWYAAFDETWRWRFDVEDLYYRRYWNQVANWVMESPFAVRDHFVAIDVGALIYEPGQTAHIRARLRDQLGRPLDHAVAEAILYQDDAKIATVPLVAEENSGGRMHADTAGLAPGRYEVGVSVRGLPPEQMKARVAFAVRGQGAGELTALNCNEELLRRMADNAGGRYFREEDTAALPGELRPLARNRTTESDYALWHRWPWFAAIATLLTAEWLLRKKLGMV